MANQTARVWETTDMALAAWMRAKGKAIVSISRVEGRYKEFRFVFDDKNSECDDLALSFLNSDAQLFDASIRALKKMCFGPKGIRKAVDRGHQ